MRVTSRYIVLCKIISCIYKSKIYSFNLGLSDSDLNNFCNRSRVNGAITKSFFLSKSDTKLKPKEGSFFSKSMTALVL